MIFFIGKIHITRYLYYSLYLAEYDGRIEYETFVKHAKEFIALSDNLFDSWTLKQHCDDQMYLVKHQLVNNSKYWFHMFSELLTTNDFMNSAFSRIFLMSFVC